MKTAIHIRTDPRFSGRTGKHRPAVYVDPRNSGPCLGSDPLSGKSELALSMIDFLMGQRKHLQL